MGYYFLTAQGMSFNFMSLVCGGKMILETERLILREMIQEDFQNLAGILRDPNHASIRVAESYRYEKRR